MQGRKLRWAALAVLASCATEPREDGEAADGGTGFAVQAIRDVGDAWIPARRIWNQQTYHVTNVREDGTIPSNELPHWEHLNTFRTQAQIAFGGNVCDPEPRG